MATKLTDEQIAKYRKIVKETTNEFLKKTIKQKLKDAGVSIEEKPAAKPAAAAKKPESAAKPVEKKPVAKPATAAKPAESKKPAAPKKVFIVDGKEINENDVNFCEKVLKAWKKRRALARTAASTYRTKSVMRIITEKVADTVEKAINNVSAAEIKKDPKAFLSKVDKLEKSAIEFLNDFKEVLGADFKKSEIKIEFDELEKMIKSKVASFKK